MTPLYIEEISTCTHLTYFLPRTVLDPTSLAVPHPTSSGSIDFWLHSWMGALGTCLWYCYSQQEDEFQYKPVTRLITTNDLLASYLCEHSHELIKFMFIVAEILRPCIVFTEYIQKHNWSEIISYFDQEETSIFFKGMIGMWHHRSTSYYW